MKKRWEDLGIEALISPSMAHCSFKAENAFKMSGMGDYNYIWNTLHYPGGVIPVTEVLPGEDTTYEDGYNDAWTKVIREDM
jgi:hypothetical protein